MQDADSFLRFAESQMKPSQRVLTFVVEHFTELFIAGIALYCALDLVERRMNRSESFKAAS